MRSNDGAWIGWSGTADDEVEPFETDGMHLVPVTLSEDDVQDYYEGFSNDTIWPLYHDVIAPPKYQPRLVGRVRATSTGGSPSAPRRPRPRAAPSGCRTTSCSSCRGCCASAATGPHIGFFNHIPFPAYGLYSQLPWRSQIIEGLLGADLIGFQRRADAGNFLRAVRRLFHLQTAHDRVELPPQGEGRWPNSVGATAAVRRGAALPDLDRRPRLHRPRRALRTCGRGRSRSATTSATRGRSCSASTGSTTRRASATASRPTRELLAEGKLDVERHGARADREPEPRARRDVQGAPRRDRADRRPRQRRLRHHPRTPRSTTCTTAIRARRWWRCSSPPTSCSSPRSATA